MFPRKYILQHLGKFVAHVYRVRMPCSQAHVRELEKMKQDQHDKLLSYLRTGKFDEGLTKNEKDSKM